MTKQTVSSMFLLSTFLIYMIVTVLASSKVIYITPSTNVSCSQQTICVTLSQFALSQRLIDFNSNLTLTFLPGNHSLTSILYFPNISTLVIHSNNESARITCDQSRLFIFLKIQSVSIYDIEFRHCHLALLKSNLNVKNSSFSLNENGLFRDVYYGLEGSRENVLTGTLYIIDSNITIFNTLFEGNQAQVGGAVYAENSTIEINQSVFKNNHVVCLVDSIVCLGGAIYTYKSTITVMFTLFESNLALTVGQDGHGGVFGLLISSANLFSNTFIHNNAVEGSGGVIFSRNSNITSDSNTFLRNNAGQYGGVLRSSFAYVTDRNSYYENNHAKYFGGVMDFSSATVTINRSKLVFNSAVSRGGAVRLERGILTIIESDISENIVERSYGGAISVERGCVDIRTSNFTRNRVKENYGGAIDVKKGDRFFIWNSNFTMNTANFGGAIHAHHVFLLQIVDSIFMFNKAKMGGALFLEASRATVTSCNFSSNSADAGGSAYLSYYQIVNLTMSAFWNNSAEKGAVLHATSQANIQMHSVTTSFNEANLGIMYFIDSAAIISGDSRFTNNNGSIFVYNSNLTIAGHAKFGNSSTSTVHKVFQEGGVITAFQSEVFFRGVCDLMFNSAEIGGALYATESKLHITSSTTIANNTAEKSGGGAYLYQSELNCQGDGKLTFLGNAATEKGGAVHAISSSLRVTFITDALTIISSSKINFTKNQAKYGGGIFLEVNAKLYILIKDNLHNGVNISSLIFSSNIALYGGGIYVADEANSGICASNSYEIHSSTTECFLQSLSLYGNRTNSYLDIKFTNNTANISGSALYGGLLDRCTVSPFSYIYALPQRSNFNSTSNHLSVISGVKYFDLYSNIKLNSISSGPVSVCFCREGHPDCRYQPPIVNVTKGERFLVELAAVDQLSKSISKAYILSSLLSGFGGLGENQTNQTTSGSCTNLKFEIFSPYSSENLKMYAVGPCVDEVLSQKVLIIHFSPCICPAGFQQKLTETTNCVCECDSQLEKYITKCDIRTKSIVRKGNPWISYFRSNNNITHRYLIYLHCPLGYCYPSGSNIHIDLNKTNGADEQCLHNRSGLLCGVCKQGLSLSLGTSRCIACQSYWPALLVLQLTAACIAGIALVASILILNLTVAVGTINGVIFYANILYTFKSTFVPHSSPSFATVLISWLNLEIGFDSCFFDGMNSYSKTWIQLAFPSYVIFLVVSIIVLSSRSDRLSNLLGKKNPVATLATLILLSYTKFLNIIIKVLSFGVISYPGLNGPISKLIWLPDATVGYFTGKHIPLMVTAILLLLVCIIYTGLLFSWQWLARFDNNKVIKLIRSQKMSHFIETYHAPYMPRNRYWTGLLLIIRLILYITSAANVSGNPNLHLFVIGLFMLGVLFLKEITGINSRIYKKWSIDVLEMSLYINISVLCISTIFTNITDDETYKAGISNTSITIVFLMLLGILFFHIHSQLIAKTNAWKSFFKGRTQFQNISDLSVEVVSQAAPTSSVVERPERPASQLLRQNSMISKTDYETKRDTLRALMIFMLIL